MKNDPRPEAVQTRPPSADAKLDDLSRAPFGLMDILRRAEGDAFGAFGLDPSECPYRVIASASYWRLRDYGTDESSAALLVVAAPIKRPYIWDLSPSASAIRYCLEQGLHVFLLEWLPALRGMGNNGLDEYAQAIAECVGKISDSEPLGKPFLIGHSLGGTLAAIYAAVGSDRLRGLVLLGAPLCFEPQTNGFRDALVSLVPPNLSQAEPFPGSLLSHMSALASPATFIWSRLIDAVLSATDQQALDIHARVERWALDEVPLPGKLVHQIIDWLYRENRFFRGELKIGNAGRSFQRLGPHACSCEYDRRCGPSDSVKPFLDAMPAANARIIDYPGEVGVCLQHLSMLVGRQARAQVWPRIISWLRSQS